MVKTPCCQQWGPRFDILGQGTKIPHTVRSSQNVTTTKRTVLSSRKSQGMQELCVRVPGQRPVSEQTVFLAPGKLNQPRSTDLKTEQDQWLPKRHMTTWLVEQDFELGSSICTLVLPWSGCLISLSFSFPICKMRMRVTVFIPRGYKCNREEHFVSYFKLISKGMLPISLNYT